jgi:hypothetical protein
MWSLVCPSSLDYFVSFHSVYSGIISTNAPFFVPVVVTA